MARKNNSETLKRKYATGELVAWNKGLTKETSESVRKNGKASGDTRKGRKLSEDHKSKIRKFNIGKKRAGTYKLSDETKKKIGLYWKGKKRDKQFSLAISEANKKKKPYHLKEETKLKISMSSKGKKKTKEHAKHISEGQKGIKRTEEAKNRMRIASRKRISRDGQWNSIGINEKELLDKQEIIDQIPIYRQYYIYKLGLKVDGYNPFVNTVYEVYELYHSKDKQKEYDLRRQKEIEECLKCKFVIIWDETH